ncbi:MAG: protein-tyrosine-phosphatase [Actinomycetota bacterium]|nr:protein-tyrosine-phosphatase [Actinomycetota bacterium]
MSAQPETGVLRILVVCTGNICRSPMAERLLATGLAVRLGPAAASVRVESAGTWSHAGAPMQPHAQATLAGMGVGPDGFRARQLTSDMVEEADLVLAASREHRAAVAVLVPRASRRTFTLCEFARLLGAVAPQDLPAGNVVARGRALIVAAAAQRGLVPPDKPEDDDIADPYGEPVTAYAAAAAAIATALERPLELLVPLRER